MRRLSSRHLILWALVLAIGIGVLFARAVLTIRDDQWAHAKATNAMLAHTIEQNITRTIDGFDHSLAGVVNSLGSFDLPSLSPELRSALLFDHSLRMRGLGTVAVLDLHGNILMESGSPVPRSGNFADRDYFRVHLRDGFQGLYIDQPVQARLSGGAPSLPMSRAYYHSDGTLAGVVVGTIRIEYFQELFASVNLGPNSRIVLWRQDGTSLAHFPGKAFDADPERLPASQLERIRASTQGTFTDTHADNGTRFLHAFRHLNGYPLIVSVDQPVETVVAQWRSSALRLGAFALLLMLACVGLMLLFVHELERRQSVSAQLREAEHDLRTILNNLPSLVAYWDRRLHNRFANEAYRQSLGVTPEQLRTQSLPELASADTYGKVRPHVERALQGHKQVFERSLLLPSGQRRHVLTSYIPDQEDGVVQGFFVQIDDLTERKHMEDLLFEEKERVRLTLQAIGDAVLCADAEGHVTYINPAAEALTGWQAFHAAGRPAAEVAPLQMPQAQSAQPHPIARALSEGTGHGAQRGLVLQRRDGQQVDIEESCRAITDRHGQVTGAVMVLRDVTQVMALSRRMAHLAQHDALTGLPNRVLLQDRAEQAIAQAQRGGHRLALLYLDLDGFKQVNDTLGHDAGDLLLVQVAQRLRAAVRESDTLSRQGGDEFIVLLPMVARPAQAATVARKLTAACASAFVLPHGEAHVGLSGGIALYPDHGRSFEELARCADTALYAAKRQGRRQFRLYAGPTRQPEPLPDADSEAGTEADSEAAPAPGHQKQ